MATAIKTTVAVEVTLTLSRTEAEALVSVLRNVAGQPSGPRSAIDNIMRALARVGINHYGDQVVGLITMPETLPPSHA